MRLLELYSCLRANPSNLVHSFIGGQKVDLTYGQIAEQVDKLVDRLSLAGVREGMFVGIAGANSHRWIVADLALIQLRCVSVCFTEQMLEESGVEPLAETFSLVALLLTEPLALPPGTPEWCTQVSQESEIELRETTSGHRMALENLHSLVFSSGTTGSQKCLKIGISGIENTVDKTADAWKVRSDDNILISLPFSNIQQRWMSYLAIAYGCNMTIVVPELVFRSLMQFQPTIVLGSPAFFEILERRFWAKPLRSRLSAFLCSYASRFLPGIAQQQLQRYVPDDISGFFGGRERLLLVGSAPSSARMLTLYHRLGLPLYQVYGMTEFGWISFNLPDRSRIGSVGKPIPGVSITIANDGEIVVSSSTLQSLGYFTDDRQLQASVYLSETDVATGDLGRIDADGYLFIDGRKKNVIIASSGIKINPEAIEAKIDSLPCICRSVVYALDHQAALGCLIFVEGAVSDTLRKDIENHIRRLNGSVCSNERIRCLVIRSDSELTIHSGMLTANYKLHRTQIWNAYRLSFEDPNQRTSLV